MKKAGFALALGTSLTLALTACSEPSTTTANSAPAADLSGNAACTALRAKHPDLNGKKLTNAINPHTPGYESIDPQHPDKFIGFDIDLGETLGSCLGFTVNYVAVGFPALLPTLQSGQANMVISDIYATTERAQAADFVTYSKVSDGVLVAKDNPKHIDGINTTLCGATAALNKGFVEVPLVQDVGPACTSKGLPPPKVELYDNNVDCFQAILAGRADTYINDVNTVNQIVKAHPDKLDKATAVTLDYSIGIAIPKNNTPFRDAIVAALTVVQDTGTQKELMSKAGLEPAGVEPPKVVS